MLDNHRPHRTKTNTIITYSLSLFSLSPTVTLRPPSSAVDSAFSGDCPPLYRMMIALSTTPSFHFTCGGSSLKSADKSVNGTTKLAFSPWRGEKSSSSRRSLTVQAGYSDGGRPSSSSIFVGGFLLGGVIVGALGCIFAPEISKALAETDKKDLMRKLPKFIYDEEKALEKQRKILSEKIDQLNDAIDDISNQLRSGDTENGAAANLDGVESVI